MIKHYRNAFTVVELIVVVVVIAIIASITVVAYTTVQRDARDTSRIAKAQDIADALELYYLNNGQYPQILHGLGNESSCGSQTDNWGHCDRLKQLTDAIAPYMRVDPASLSNATQGNYYYSYASQGGVNNFQSYGLVVFLEGNKGASDGGIYPNGYEVGDNPKYCAANYTGSNSEWLNKPADYNRLCQGGN